MMRRTPEEPRKSKHRFQALAYEQELGNPLLAAIAHSGTIGFAVCDQRFRFHLVNEAWALMHGVPREAHLGATMRAVLGPAARTFEVVFERVFSSGKPLWDYEFSARLPARTEKGYWITCSFPIRNASEKLKLVAAVILEITQLRRLEISFHKLLTDSARLLEALFAGHQFLGEAVAGQPLSPRKRPRMGKISPREEQVIKLLGQSKSNKEIAAALGISVRTIETYRARIMLKLRVHSLSELVHYAIRNRITEP
jgi:DNA-binding CsgD family transcriptional regulator